VSSYCQTVHNKHALLHLHIPLMSDEREGQQLVKHGVSQQARATLRPSGHGNWFPRQLEPELLLRPSPLLCPSLSNHCSAHPQRACDSWQRACGEARIARASAPAPPRPGGRSGEEGRGGHCRTLTRGWPPRGRRELGHQDRRSGNGGDKRLGEAVGAAVRSGGRAQTTHGKRVKNKRHQHLAHPRAKPWDYILETERWRRSASTAAAHLGFHGGGVGARRLGFREKEQGGGRDGVSIGPGTTFLACGPSRGGVGAGCSAARSDSRLRLVRLGRRREMTGGTRLSATAGEGEAERVETGRKG
jgi:hypothetical protein